MASKCPFSYLWENKTDTQGSPHEASESRQKSSERNIASDEQETGSNSSKERSAEVGTCPLGFGSGKEGPRMGLFHCIICKSIMFEASITNCGHTFCKHCIEKCRDCPACGADITDIQPNIEIQEAIDEFVAAHAGDVSFWELEDVGFVGGKEMTNKTALERVQDRAYFHLQAGMRAMSGGNIPNARHQFTESKRVFEEYVRGDSAERTAVLPQLGAVYGCLGDCERNSGHVEEAKEYYTKSIDAVQESLRYSSSDKHRTGSSTNETLHALSVSLNKVGELHHIQGELQEALSYYQRALDVRRESLDTYLKQSEEIQPEIEVSLMLDVATSRAKVADAMQACGNAEDAAALDADTRALLQDIQGKLHQCHAASSHAKFKALSAHFSSSLHSA
ncbi:hypothetical protein M9435_002484 [Picochlorum sp. BPE23]|nr:hypothetical protein M9435_002484 [Picochlorum sp. BPE23]